jgi:predicted transposase YbfD/YdcC
MVYANTLHPELKQKWSSIDSLVRVDRVSVHKGETSQETAYFISDLPPETPAEYFYEGVRSHWQIESFHYVKDVTLGEDRSKVRTRNAPQNYSLMRNMVINLFRRCGLNAIQESLEKCANNVPFMMRLL